MKTDLLIVGAGIYGTVVKEIADGMGCFERIAFVDDRATETPSGGRVLGTTADLGRLAREFGSIAVAIGNPDVKLSLIRRIEAEIPCELVTLVSPRAYVSPSAQLGKGTVVEPMATVHAGCVLGKGCIVSAGAVINHFAVCGDGVHVDCNATVPGNVTVPPAEKIQCGTVFKPLQ